MRAPAEPATAHAVPVKRPRVAGKENTRSEQAMMDDLLAGLDASVFDVMPASSPAKSSQVRRPREALGIKREVEMPARKRRKIEVELEVSPLKSVKQVRRQIPKVEEMEIKVEQQDMTYTTVELAVPEGGVDIAALKDEIKEGIFEDELYSFDFDLGDLSAFDDDLLEKPPETKYPILHPAVPAPPAGFAPTPWARCKVNAVFSGLRFDDGVIPDDLDAVLSGPSTSFGKTIIVTLASDSSKRVIHLKERWADTPIRIRDTVNIISLCFASPPTTSPPPPILISFKQPTSYLIHHPDLLLTMTSIANAMPCPRKPILQSLLKPPGPSSKSMIYGTILHSLLQGALSEQNFEPEQTMRRVQEEMSREERRLELWGAGLGEEDVKLEVGAKAGKGFEVFEDKWIGKAPKAGGELHTSPGENPALLAITGLHEIEEDIWSPKWGLKGKVDASVQASIIRDSSRPDVAVEENVAPLEIKTGRSVGVMAHRAQTILYTLLMEDRYGVPVPAGLLYYSQLDSILRVEAKANEIRALIIARNELASYLATKRSVPVGPATETSPPAVDDIEGPTSFLPPTIDNANECKRCYAVDTCMLYRKAVDRVEHSEDDPIGGLYEEKMGEMTEKHTEFFRKWETLLTVEEQDMGRFRSQLWTMGAKERERSGRCFADMVIASYSNDLGKSLAKIHRHTYTFIRSPTSASQLDTSPTKARDRSSLLSGHIAKGDPVSLSLEPDLLCLSRGFVTDLTPTTIIISVTYPLDTTALLARTTHTRRHALRSDDVRWRIDKDEMTSGMQRMRANLAQLFLPGGDSTRRRLIVDLDPPTFDGLEPLRDDEIPAGLNDDQVEAMRKVMAARHYALILGMPGTGKTSTIAEIIKALVARGKSVLLTSYTHSAVDTILMKLQGAEFGVLRLGNIDKVHPDVQHLTLEAYEGSTSMHQLESRLMGPPVVAATCLAIEHPLFFRRKFDYCIVDEASQITLPTCLGPLRMADRFVLVGDHFQLPPIVRNPEARRGGLDVSLFRLLSEAHPHALTALSHQYRMNEEIMLLSNRLVYEGRLKCGNEAVAKQGLTLPKGALCGGQGHACEEEDSCWVKDMLRESTKAVFVDTDSLPARDMRVGDLVQNPTEAKLVYQLAHALTLSGVNQSDIAIITPYRQQIKLLSSLFSADMPRIEILTADKSQGRDKEVVLISLVRSNENGMIGDLLKDWRRINVSFTRAKRKLVIFGSGGTLGQDPLLSEFLGLMEGRGWVYRLQKGAEDGHAVPSFDVGKEAGKSKRKLDKDTGAEEEKGQGKVGERILEKLPFVKELMMQGC